MLSKKELALADAEVLTAVAENAEMDDKIMTREGPSKVLREKKLKQGRLENSCHNHVARLCERFGGRQREGNTCRYRATTCFHCRISGRWTRNCNNCEQSSSHSKSHVQAKALEAAGSSPEETETEELQEWNMESRTVDLVPAVRRNFFCGRVDLLMELDTRSPVCVI